MLRSSLLRCDRSETVLGVILERGDVDDGCGFCVARPMDGLGWSGGRVRAPSKIGSGVPSTGLRTASGHSSRMVIRVQEQ